MKHFIQWIVAALAAISLISITLFEFHFENIEINVNPTTPTSLPTATNNSSSIETPCVEKNNYVCQRLAKMKAWANQAEQQSVTVERRSEITNDNLTQDTIQTCSKAVIINSTVLSEACGPNEK